MEAQGGAATFGRTGQRIVTVVAIAVAVVVLLAGVSPVLSTLSSHGDLVIADATPEGELHCGGELGPGESSSISCVSLVSIVSWTLHLSVGSLALAGVILNRSLPLYAAAALLAVEEPAIYLTRGGAFQIAPSLGSMTLYGAAALILLIAGLIRRTRANSPPRPEGV